MLGTAVSKACAKIVARAIVNTQKFNATEHDQCLKGFSALQKAHPEASEDIDEYRSWTGNRSACAKDLAKAGLVSEGDPSARAREVAAAVDEVAAGMKNITDAPAPTPAKSK
jgi:hypothetical protein